MTIFRICYASAMFFAILVSLSTSSARAAHEVVFDWGSDPEASDFHGNDPASTTVDGVTLSAHITFGSNPHFTISTFGSGIQSLGARGIGSSQNFDGEHFAFSFDRAGVLSSITLGYDADGSYNLTTPHDGTHHFGSDFSGARFAFEPGEQFTLAQASGTYRIKTMTIVPEPAAAVLLAIGLVSLAGRTMWRQSRS